MPTETERRKKRDMQCPRTRAVVKEFAVEDGGEKTRCFRFEINVNRLIIH